MNRKQFLLLLVLLLVIGGLGLVIYKRDSATWKGAERSESGKLLTGLPINDVSQLIIKDAQAELNLHKKEDRWRVRERHDYPANFDQLSEFLRQAADLRFVRTEKVGPSLLPRLHLVAPGSGADSGTLVEFKDAAGKSLGSLLLGKKHMRQMQGSAMGDESWPDGRYVMVGSDANKIGLISNPLSNIEPKPESWLDKTFFKVENLRSIAVTTAQKTNDWRVTRENAVGEFKLASPKEGEQLDPAKTSGLSSALASPSFNDVLASEAKPADTGLDTPTVVTLETFDGFTYTVKIGKPAGEDHHLQLAVTAKFTTARDAGKEEKAEEKERLDKEHADKLKRLEEKLQQEKSFEKWVYLVPKWNLEALLKTRAELLLDKKEEQPVAAGTPATAPQ